MTDKLTTLEMEIGLINHFDESRNIIVPNVSWGIIHEYKPLHECDLLVLRPSLVGIEIEIKISASDLRSDFHKVHEHDHPLITKIYYAVPRELEELALELIPDHAGLLVVDRLMMGYYTKKKGYWKEPTYGVYEVKKAKKRKGSIKWSVEQRDKLLRLGVMRIINLKRKILKMIVN